MPTVLTTSPNVATAQSVERLVDEICSVVGAPYDPEIRDKALKCLDRVATRLNVAGIYLQNLKEHKVGLTKNQNYVSISGASNYGWPYGAPYVVATSSCCAASATVGYLRWQPWERFKLLDDNMATEKTTTKWESPLYCSIQSEVFDKKLYLYKVPCSSSSLAVHMPYFSKVQRPSEESTLTVSDEVYEALQSGAEAMLMRFKYASQPNVWQPMMQDFELILARLKAAASRLHTEGANLTIQPVNNAFSGQ